MEKKVFEIPQATITVFETADILTLSPANNGSLPTVKW